MTPSEEVVASIEMAYAAFERSLPQIVSTVLLVIAALVIAFSLKAITSFILNKVIVKSELFPSVRSRLSLLTKLKNIPVVAGAIVFWVVIIFFGLAIIENLGFETLSELISQFTEYIPRIIASLVIILIGFIVGDLLSGTVSRTLRRYGIAKDQVFSRVAYLLVVTIAIILGIDQLGIDSTIITWLFIMSTGTVLGSAGLAFAIGARQTVGNMLAVRQVIREFSIGEQVTIQNQEGTIAGFTSVSVKIRQHDNELHIPASRFLEETVVVKKAGN